MRERYQTIYAKEEGLLQHPLQDCTSKHLLKNWKSKD
jgi:S-adenosylmethionine:tRNA-ribosyltransferase-isomerase (queuine synthetase)